MPKFNKEKPKEKTLAEVAFETGGWHQAQKESKKELEGSRLEFFKKVTELNRDKPRATKTFLLNEPLDLLEAEARAIKYNAGWTIKSNQEVKGKGWKFILEEDPEFVGHSEITDPTDDEPGYVVTKTIKSGTTMIDLDRMEKENYNLYFSVTYVPEEDLIRGILDSVSLPKEEWGAVIDNTLSMFSLKRQPKPAEQLTEKQQAAIRPYMYEAPKSLALNVRLAKPTDYDETT